MFNEDIYSRLLAGESVESIAKELTDALNAAQVKFAEEEAARKAKAEEEAKAKADAEARAAAKRNTLHDLIGATLHFCAAYYPSFGITVEEVDAMDDETLYALTDLALGVLDIEARKPVAKSKLKVKVAKEPDIFAEFFKAFGL